MKKRWTILTAFLTMGVMTQVQGQAERRGESLIYNGSFEEYGACPKRIESLGIMREVDAWYQPTGGSADYFNACGGRECRVPKNKLGEQEAHSGAGYCGIYCSKDEYREYLQTRIKKPLKKGGRYRLRMYVSLAEHSSAAVGTIGAYISREMIEDTARGILTREERREIGEAATQTLTSHYRPQIENAAEKTLRDTERWMEIEGEFTAEGGEEYVTIGNFETAAHSGVSYPTELTYLLPGAYYYIDDVSLEYIGETEVSEKEESEGKKEEQKEERRYERGSTLVLRNIYFEFDKAVILQQSYNELRQIEEMLKENEQIRIEVGGHTDGQGSARYNQRLSESRAKAVAEYLIGRGIGKGRVSYKGYGESKPIDSNESEEGRKNNRRVEIKIL